ncbi:GNAT family N-acetyltransferase [Hyalangium versicolor]|uniref:GNAT family N-acetyltransferase n=1 Tax=Hyalangium versicolor TaxID=2861190 RepID=UPI001CCD3AC9|nr:GNAT family N-acetyltransferase [Hyalangium versicolor]
MDTPEAFIACSNVPWNIMNLAFLRAPVETEAALERSVAAARQYFTPRKLAWMYVAGEDWLSPGLRPKADAVLQAQGLKRAMTTTGMVAEHLVEPTRPLPSIDIHHVTDEEGARHIADVNALSYASSLEVARQSTGASLFRGDSRGYVGFVEGKAVSVAAVIRVEGIAYVAYVATLESHRRRGYAEAVIRQGLEDARRWWGLERTVLHATDAGRPVYLRMGYRDVTRFGFYAPADAGH